MPISREQHAAFCSEAQTQYLADRDPAGDAIDWKNALWDARRSIVGFLRASSYLTDVSAALEQSGAHALALRHFLAPPVSQDQFALICTDWSKASEKSGKPVQHDRAVRIAAAFDTRRNRRLSPWIDQNRLPAKRELYSIIGTIAPLIASQRLSTARRNRLAARQEGDVVRLLTERGWTKLRSGLVDARGELPLRSFMHKARYASGPNENQEVDVACGLGGTVVLALECKVTNDITNSTKRINDVLKKATAWKQHWGTFVRPAALLQGVIKFKDVQRLLDADVEVFWSHRLDLFDTWLIDNERS